MLSKFYQVNLQEKIPLGRPRRRWEDNIRMNLKRIGVNIINLIGLTHDRRAFECEVLNL